MRRAIGASSRPAGGAPSDYLAAGCRVAALADLLLAVWDGEPARGRGGTADVVAFARRNLIPYVHLNPLTREIIKADGPF